MKNVLLAFLLLFVAVPLVHAQQPLNNDAVIKLSKAGLSDDVIIATIKSSAGAYNTTPDGLVQLRAGGVSNYVIQTILRQNLAAPAPQAVVAGAAVAEGPRMPRVFLRANSTGNTWSGLFRNQAMEMTDDFGKSCSTVTVTVSESNADYYVDLNHVEVGLLRDNQLRVVNKNGDIVVPPKHGESIAGGVKRACAAITSNWAAVQAPVPPPPPPGQ